MTIDSIRPASHILASIDLPWPQAFLEFVELRHGYNIGEWRQQLQDF
jgi:hypothetical protein